LFSIGSWQSFSTDSDSCSCKCRYFCGCPKPGPIFPTSYVVIFFMFNGLRWNVVVCFVDINEIVDHQCLNFLFLSEMHEKKVYVVTNGITVSSLFLELSLSSSKWYIFYCFHQLQIISVSNKFPFHNKHSCLLTKW